MHPRYGHYLFGFLLSGFMSFMVSGIATFRAIGLPADFLSLWMEAWIPSWVVAFPIVLVVAPIVRRIVDRVVVHPEANTGPDDALNRNRQT